MKKKGFTLIELLAVIVILAIIALIATPAVLNIIEDSRKSAAEASARNIMSTAETYYMSKLAKGESVGTIDLSGSTLVYNGDQASKGYVTFDNNGNASGQMYISGYCVTHNVDNTVSSTKMEEDECEIEVPIKYHKYNNGDYVFYNPKDNVKCEAATSSATGTNDTCKKWYAFLDSESSSTVNLILDHNTTDYVDWGNRGEETPTVANAELQEDIINWNAAVKSTARLIKVYEINRIAPTSSGFTWSQRNLGAWYYLHTGYPSTNNKYVGAAGSNTYAWLFDNTYNCTTYGCNVADGGTYGYWTLAAANHERAWYVKYDGSLYHDFVTGGDDIVGVRPVITVSKSIFE